MLDVLDRLATWDALDSWATATAAVAAAACAVPGVFLVLRKQSLLGDALSHTALLGVVGAYLLASMAESSGVLPAGSYAGARQLFLIGGAVVVGLATAWLSELLAWFGRIDRTVSLAVLFTTAFAGGLLLLRAKADAVHIDPDCVLFGEVELAVLDTFPGTPIPRPLAIAAVALLLNLLFIAVWFRALRAAAFDPAYAESAGINTRRLHLAQITLTAVTLVAAFESVGSILAVAMLVLPAATARFLTNQLWGLIGWSIGLSCAAAIIGHAASFTLPPALFGGLGFETVEDSGTAGAMTAVAGVAFVAALLFGRRGGVLVKG